MQKGYYPLQYRTEPGILLAYCSPCFPILSGCMKCGDMPTLSHLLIILTQQRRRLVQPGRGLRKVHRRPRQLDFSRLWMVAFPDIAACLDMRVVENLAHTIDGTTGDTGSTQLWQPFIGRAREERFLQYRHQLVPVTHSLWVRSKTRVARQVFTA